MGPRLRGDDGANRLFPSIVVRSSRSLVVHAAALEDAGLEGALMMARQLTLES